jgi:predicted small secreted protein
MRKINFSIVIMAALLLAVGFVFTACENSTGGGGNTVTYTGSAGDTTYRLTITKTSAKAAYVPQDGDSYVLVIGSGSKRSEGTVTIISGGFRLAPKDAPAKTFTVTVNVNGITAIAGDITLTGGGTEKPPATVTPGGGSSSGDNSSDLLDAQGNLSPAKLNGTVWAYTVDGDSMMITFTSTTAYKVTYSFSTDVDPGTYKVSGKSITFTDQEGAIYGKIEGNTLFAEDPTGQHSAMPFTRIK